MQETRVVIDKHFNGPNVSANGGYACGMMAEVLPQDQAATMRLLAPPPLEVDLRLVEDNGHVELIHGNTVIGTGESSHLDPARPELPDNVNIYQAAENPISSSFDFLRQCYVCGPDRQEDGLHIHPGSLIGRDGEVACFWQTALDQADQAGFVDGLRLWSALDCPGYFASAAGKPALLGSMTAQILGAVKAGEIVTVHAWTKSISGRKHRAGVALYGPNRDCIALADQTWVVVKDEMFDSLRG
ncbi:hotdog fold domain-containing protein [Temperatibacter marinus]|uniref:Hotdog fold domain-containing protein n=1 Tax=Temperatibacter marinus TaxID=1456591 RepID=A0AA52EJU3_9PROT|nr:hotdog fold domain-containing protein [Temperatibacter marinus]WND04120.1 hotdog fold domain-containing protein [Temperatibacter marinus]